MVSRVLVRPCYEPCGRVRDSLGGGACQHIASQIPPGELTYKVENLACYDEIVQAVHELLDRGVVVPVVHVEDVDI